MVSRRKARIRTVTLRMELRVAHTLVQRHRLRISLLVRTARPRAALRLTVGATTRPDISRVLRQAQRQASMGRQASIRSTGSSSLNTVVSSSLITAVNSSLNTVSSLHSMDSN